MGVPLYVKGVIMIVEVGSFWLIKDSDCVAIVRSIIGKSNGELTVVYTVTDNSGVSSYRMSCEYELFMNIAEKLITKSELKDELNKEYVKGKTDGYGEGYQHGFTLAKEKITELDKEEFESEYQRGLKEGQYLGKLDSLNSRQYHYHLGYDDALAHMASEEAENRLEIKKQGFEDGYNTAIKEMKSDKLNSGVCGDSVPNKETQEAMQEVLDKDSNEFLGIWVAKDGSGKLKVLSVNESVCDVELVEYVNSYFLCAGATATIEINDLKEHWNKENPANGDNNNNDVVNSPKHYNSDPSGVQCIEITRHRNNNIGNVIKYLWRNGLKDGNSNIQDLEKGAWYLNDEIQRLKGIRNGLE